MSPRPHRNNSTSNIDKRDPTRRPTTREINASESSDMTHPVIDMEEDLCTSSSSSASSRSASIGQQQQQQQVKRPQQEKQSKGSTRSLKQSSSHSLGGKSTEKSSRRSFRKQYDDRLPSEEDYDSDEALDNFEAPGKTGTDDDVTPVNSSFRDDDDDDDDDDDNSSFFSSSSLNASGHDSTRTSSADSANTRSTGDLETSRLAKKEATAVRRRRITAVIVILVLAAILITVILVVGENELSDTFGEEFENFSQELGKAWQMSVAALFVAMDALAVDVSLGTETSDWPFVTLPEFGIVATSLRYNQPSVVSTALTPVVTEENKLAYENYTASNNDWILETLTWQLAQQVLESETNGTRRLHPRQLQDESVSFTDGTADQIYEIDTETDMAMIDKGPSPYFPIRTIDPLQNTRLINYNLGSNIYLQENVELSFIHTKAIVGPVVPMDEEPLTMDPDESVLIGSMSYPVIRTAGSSSTETVGVLSILFNWPALIQDILPTEAEGIVCVMRNTCNQVVTMQVNGANAYLLGGGDLHDAEYDSYAITYNLESGLDDLQMRTVSRVGFDDSSPCQFSMTVYPSSTTQAAYNSQAATCAAIAAGVAFFVALLVFIAYDYIQERRNRSILRAAREARAIVSSLFPASVRDRLFETSREKQRQKEKKKRKKLRKLRRKSKASDEVDGAQSDKITGGNHLSNIDNICNLEASPSCTSDVHQDALLSPTTVKKLISRLDHPPLDYLNETASKQRNTAIVSHPKHRLKTFLNSSVPPLDLSGHGSFNGMDKPIADLFPHTTVLFADIAGFTAWSSEREPEQVFTLLQTVYQNFDRIARRRNVFKVEVSYQNPTLCKPLDT
jgi:NADH:ubiquinone oxidoreductase subunit 6 (subunit J)